MLSSREPVAAQPPADSRRSQRRRWLWLGLGVLFLLASSLRVYEFFSHHWGSYLHDPSSHSTYVGYVNAHHRLPPVDDDLEYPQQPLYYVLAAPFYHANENADENVEHLAPLGLVISILSLVLTLASLRYLSAWLLRYGLFLFIGFNPAFVLLSCGVGNDGLAALCGTLFFFSLLRLNRNPRSLGYFVLAALAILGALLTKLNGVVLLAAIPWLLWRAAQGDASLKPTAWRFASMVLVLVVWAGCVLDRAWLKDRREFVFVHAWIWDYLEIKENFLVYALSFRLPDLIAAGQASTTNDTPDSVRFSFPTWEYGNMLLSENGYTNDKVLGVFSRLVLISGTYLLLALGLFVCMTLLSRPLWPWPHLFSLNRIALLLVAGSTALILYYVHSVPDTCNADYRFQSATFPWMGYCIGRGMCAFPRSRFWRRTMICFMALFLGASLCFLVALYVRR
jgi:hypothetical protein